MKSTPSVIALPKAIAMRAANSMPAVSGCGNMRTGHM